MAWRWFGWFRRHKPYKDYKARRQAIAERSQLESDEASREARGAERQTRINLRVLGKQIEKAAEILAKLSESVASKNPENIKSSWIRGKSDVAELVKIKVKIVANAALIAKILAESVSIVKPSKSKQKIIDQLKIFKSSLLADSAELGNQIKKIVDSIRKIEPDTAANHRLWGTTSAAVVAAQQTLEKILEDGEAALAIEQNLRRQIGRG